VKAHIHNVDAGNNRQSDKVQTVDKKAIYWIFVISVQKCDPPHNLVNLGIYMTGIDM
jgi:hypothetical protein